MFYVIYIAHRFPQKSLIISLATIIMELAALVKGKFWGLKNGIFQSGIMPGLQIGHQEKTQGQKNSKLKKKNSNSSPKLNFSAFF